MNRWMVGFIAACLVALASNAYWFAIFVDAATAESYLNDSIRAEARKFTALGELVVAGSVDYTQADFLHLLRQAGPEAIISEDENRIYYEDIEFAFENDRLAAVR